MKKVKFIAFSDLHLNQWNISYEYSGDRLADGIKAFEVINKRAGELGVKMLFAGDLFHRFKSLDNEVLDAFSDVSLNDFLVGIDGNHDQVKANTHKVISPAYFNTFSKLNKQMICVNGRSVVTGDGYMIHGIPYMKHNVGFKTYLKKAHKERLKHPKLKHILLIHTDLPGAMKDNGMVADSVENIKSLKIFKGFDLVLCGHIHKSQIITKNIIILGSPYQQSLSEMGDQKGYWEIYEDLTFSFVPIKGIPTYKKYDSDKPPKDLSKYIWVPEKIKALEFDNGSTIEFDVNQGRQDIARAYFKTTNQKGKGKRSLLISLIKKVS